MHSIIKYYSREETTLWNGCRGWAPVCCPCSEESIYKYVVIYTACLSPALIWSNTRKIPRNNSQHLSLASFDVPAHLQRSQNFVRESLLVLQPPGEKRCEACKL